MKWRTEYEDQEPQAAHHALPDPFDSLTLDDLPNNSLVEVGEACGLEVAKKLMIGIPGTNLVIPVRGLQRVQESAERAGREQATVEDMPTSTWKQVAELCGVDVPLALFEALGNHVVVVPLNPLNKMMHRYIVEHRRPGENDISVMRALGISHTRYQTLLDFVPKKPGNPLQTSLL